MTGPDRQQRSATGAEGSYTEQEWRLRALSPLDGRYGRNLAGLAACFSEEALVRERFAVEVAWLEYLADLPEVVELEPLTPGERAALHQWASSFGLPEAMDVKKAEARTNHDVKAVEYHLKSRLTGELGWPEERAEFAHFGATSEDINNIAYAQLVRYALAQEWLPAAEGLVADVQKMAIVEAGRPMLARTHGQPATPTTFGKELAVFVARWRRQLKQVKSVEIPGKWGGATGTLAAHCVAYPELDWLVVARGFVSSLGLEWEPLTTQIEPHDWLAELFDAISRFCTVLLDFCRDMWSYTSLGYLRLKVVEGEVGSSAMPHKLNPIDFENAEANAGIAIALLSHLAQKLPVSRMQRDLSDSSALRNVGSAFGYSFLAVSSARRGFARTTPDAAVLDADLDGSWEVLTEAVQTVMRRYGISGGYEQLKGLSQGKVFSAEALHHFVRSLGLPSSARERLMALTPNTYTGLARDLANLIDGRDGEPEQ